MDKQTNCCKGHQIHEETQNGRINAKSDNLLRVKRKIRKIDCHIEVDETSPVLDWLASVAGTMHQVVKFHEGVVNPADAVRVGFATLRTAMRSWGISSPPDLSLWFRDQGFAMT